MQSARLLLQSQKTLAAYSGRRCLSVVAQPQFRLASRATCIAPLVPRCISRHRFNSTNALANDVPKASLSEKPSEHAAQLTKPSESTPYRGPLTTTFRRLKIFSLSSLTLTFLMSPLLFVLETTSSMPLVARTALVGIALGTSGVSTGLIAWCGRPYVTTLRWLPQEGTQGGNAGLEMTTLTLALHPRITRVYDTSFLVPTSRPFSTWELAEAFKLAPAEVEAGRRDGTLPREETVAETMDKDGGVIGRWIVRWDEEGTGTCREVGKVIRYFNVHQELLDRPLRQ